MQKYARIVSGTVVEVIDWDPAGRYAPEWVWTPCPEATRVGATYDGQSFTNPVEDPGADPGEPVIEYEDLAFASYISLVKSAGGMSSAQAVEVLQTSVEPDIVLLRIMLTQNEAPISRDHPLVLDGLNTLIQNGYIDQAGLDAVLANWPQKAT